MADKPSSSKKRLVKNPDTFRERAIKASEAEAQPSKRGRVKQAFAKVFSPILRPIGGGLKSAYNWKPLGPLRKVFHFSGKILFPTYFRNSWKELKLVTWPNWQQSRALTFAVLVFAAIFGTAIALVDLGLDKIFRHILLK
ncbi:MAG TPA: preprotein translocase subunit SecE [Candidatus Saccharimonadia bacterium]|nr:preprotein translocase subunit SecE [Candidatus Saccharimonadia bacterium]